MTIINRFSLGVKYFSGHYRRYLFLILAISFGFAIITTMTSLSKGMYENVYRAAKQHYGGQLFVLGFHKQYGMIVEDDQLIMDAVSQLDIQPDRIIRRALNSGDGTLYFAGNAARLKSVYGVDFDDEAEDFSMLEYSGGSSENLKGSNGILISEPIADQLNARVGDDLVLNINTKTGQKNTGTFIVQGIFKDTSIFGYFKCYVDRTHLNRLRLFNDDDYFSLGLYFKDQKDASGQSLKLYEELSKKLPLSPMITKKEEYSSELGKNWEGVRYIVMTLELFISQVSDLLSAMELISYFLYIMISLIVFVSIAVTYRLIIHERTSEIGTMRAIGFQQNDILNILIIEALIVFILSLVLGFVFSLFILWIVSLYSFSVIPGFEIFMNKGRLLPLFTLRDIFSNIGLLAFIIFPALWFPSIRASRLHLATSLSGDK